MPIKIYRTANGAMQQASAPFFFAAVLYFSYRILLKASNSQEKKNIDNAMQYNMLQTNMAAQHTIYKKAKNCK